MPCKHLGQLVPIASMQRSRIGVTIGQICQKQHFHSQIAQKTHKMHEIVQARIKLHPWGALDGHGYIDKAIWALLKMGGVYPRLLNPSPVSAQIPGKPLSRNTLD